MIWIPEYDILAQYNAEVMRGILHTPEWKEKMRRIQKEYDEERLSQSIYKKKE